MLKIRFGVAKVNKYANRDSGDTLELVERPLGMGGLTAVLVDGQGSGKGAKTISNFVAGNCVTMIKQGVRDSVVARAASDQLYNYRTGQVSATLNLLSVDFVSQTLVITRNNPQPVYLYPGPAEEPAADAGTPEILRLEEESVPLGIYPRTRPVVREFALKPGLLVVAFTDGLSSAGERFGNAPVDVVAVLQNRLAGRLAEGEEIDPQSLADELMTLALAADKQLPQDDTSIVVLATSDLAAEDGTAIPRRLSAELTYLLRPPDSSRAML